jgi:hypothetical protein
MAGEVAVEIIEKYDRKKRGRPPKYVNDEERKAAEAKSKRDKRAKKKDVTKATFLLVVEYENLKAEVGCDCGEVDDAYLGNHYCDPRLNELAERIEQECGVTRAELARYEWQLRRQKEVGTGDGKFMRDAPQGLGELVFGIDVESVPEPDDLQIGVKAQPNDGRRVAPKGTKPDDVGWEPEELPQDVHTARSVWAWSKRTGPSGDDTCKVRDEHGHTEHEWRAARYLRYNSTGDLACPHCGKWLVVDGKRVRGRS